MYQHEKPSFLGLTAGPTGLMAFASQVHHANQNGLKLGAIKARQRVVRREGPIALCETLH
jgi:hypothetical protein